MHSSFSIPPLHERTLSTLGAPAFLDGRDLPPKPDRVCKRFKFYVRKANLPERYSHLSPEVLGKAMEETFGRS